MPARQVLHQLSYISSLYFRIFITVLPWAKEAVGSWNKPLSADTRIYWWSWVLTLYPSALVVVTNETLVSLSLIMGLNVSLFVIIRGECKLWRNKHTFYLRVSLVVSVVGSSGQALFYVLSDLFLGSQTRRFTYHVNKYIQLFSSWMWKKTAVKHEFWVTGYFHPNRKSDVRTSR